MLDGMSDSIQRSSIENLHSREVDRQSPTGLIFFCCHTRLDSSTVFSRFLCYVINGNPCLRLLPNASEWDITDKLCCKNFHSYRCKYDLVNHSFPD